MAVANVEQLTNALNQVYKTFETKEVQLDHKESRGLNERSAAQLLAEKYHKQLSTARAAFLQEFRNHSVVVDAEVRKIREELTAKFEEEYKERFAQMRQKSAEAAGMVAKHRDEIAQLKQLACTQETYLAALRQRWGVETRERLQAEIEGLKAQLESARSSNTDLEHQLLCRNELVVQLGSETSTLQQELAELQSALDQERLSHEERIRSLTSELEQQRDMYKTTLTDYEAKFVAYKEMTAAQLRIQEILRVRATEALSLMEQERQRHAKARTKPSNRIAAEGNDELDQVPREKVEIRADTRYRVDEMGMDTSWREYKIAQPDKAPSGRKVPQFRVERTRQRVALGASVVENFTAFATPCIEMSMPTPREPK